MGKRWYGSINNRLDENRMFCKDITIGTPVTEFLYTDRIPYEVTKVIDQKHVFIRAYNCIGIGKPMSNEWEFINDPSKPEVEIKYRYNHWYRVLKDRTGKITYSKMNLSFGIAEKYYCYEL